MTGAEQLAELFAKVSGRVVSPLSSPERKVVEVEVEKVETKVSKVLAELARGASHVDELAINLNMGQAMLSMVLLDLELKHWVTREAGNHFSSNVRLKR